MQELVREKESKKYIVFKEPKNKQYDVFNEFSRYYGKEDKEVFSEIRIAMDRLNKHATSDNIHIIEFIQSKDPSTLKEYRNYIGKESILLMLFVDSYVKNKKAYDAFAKAMFGGIEEFKINNFRDVLKAYVRVLKNRNFIKLLSAIKERFPQLYRELSRLDLIAAYLVLKKVLPALLSTGMPISKAISVLLDMLKTLNNRNKIRMFLLSLEKIKEYILTLGTPDGSTIELLIGGKTWM